MFRRFQNTIVLLLGFASENQASRNRLSFQHFFPDVEVELQNAVVNNCSEIFHLYMTEHVTLYGHYCVKMFNCVMTATTEYTKANFASAGVLLGLTPTVLATAGSTTPELAMLASRRPLLTLLIVLGSPAVNALRALDYNKSIVDFKQPDNAVVPFQYLTLAKSGKQQKICVGLELFFASAAVANLAQLSFIINRNTVAIMSCDNSDVLVELWIAMALITHGLGTATFFSRSPILYRETPYWSQREFKPCASHEVAEIFWEPRQNKRFVVLSWFTSVFTLCHLAFGTIMFSSLYFVRTPWAAYIIARFLVSALICRTIVAFELAGMKAVDLMAQQGLSYPE